MPGDEPGCGRLFTDNSDNVCTVEITSFTEEGLRFIYVGELIIQKLVILTPIWVSGQSVTDSPSSEGLCTCFHIAFGIIGLIVHPDAH